MKVLRPFLVGGVISLLALIFIKFWSSGYGFAAFVILPFAFILVYAPITIGFAISLLRLLSKASNSFAVIKKLIKHSN